MTHNDYEKEVLIIIPAYNERGNIEKLIVLWKEKRGSVLAFLDFQTKVWYTIHKIQEQEG